MTPLLPLEPFEKSVIGVFFIKPFFVTETISFTLSFIIIAPHTSSSFKLIPFSPIVVRPVDGISFVEK